MYSISRITDGIGIENREECNHWAELSSALATPLRISTTARRAVQTLIGSNEAFRTKTRRIHSGSRNITWLQQFCQSFVSSRCASNCRVAWS